MTTAGESELALSIRARILPTIEGSDQFFQTLEQTPNRITAPMQQLAQEPGFQQGLTPGQISKAQIFAGGEDVMEVQDYQERIKKLRDELATSMKASEMSGHKLTNFDLFNMHKKMLKEQSSLDDFREKQLAAIDEMDLPKEKKEFMKEALVVGIKDASAGLDELNPKLKEMVDQMKQGGAAGESLYAMLKQGGYLALMGQATQTAMSWTLSEARISAKELTAFNLQSPMGSYTATEEAKEFKETTERTRESELIGKIVGAIAAVGLVTATGGMGAIPLAAMAAGGSMFGGMIGGQFAEIENTESRAKLEADIKYRSQTLSKAEQSVQSAVAYEISKFKAEQRFGKEIGGTGELGYSADETLELKKSFAGNFGKMDESSFKEKTLFAREKGLDPRELYQFGEMERLTGRKIDYGEFKEIGKEAKELYGANSDQQRVIEVLKDIREVSLKQLKAGVDTHDAIKFAVDLPKMLMGVDSAYGRSGDLAKDTVGAFERFAHPQNTAQEALLFRALGKDGMFGDEGYLMRKREGIFNQKNFKDIMGTLQEDAGGSMNAAQAMLEGYDPQGTIPTDVFKKMQKLLATGKTTVKEFELDEAGQKIPIEGKKGEFKTVEKEEQWDKVFTWKDSDAKELTREQKELAEGFRKLNDSVSTQEAHLTRMREMELETAKGFQATIFKSQEESAKFWTGMSHNAEVQKDMVDTIKKGIDAQYLWMITSGIEKNPAKIKDFLNEQKEEAYERAGIKDPNKLSIEKRREILEEQGYKEIERRVQQSGSLPEEMKEYNKEKEKNKERTVGERGAVLGMMEDYDNIKIPEAYRNEQQKQAPETKELTARLEGLEGLNRTIDTLIFKFDTLGDKIELASLRQGNVSVEVKSAENNVYGQQTDFIEDRA
jgi:hypothetical protein